MAYERWESVGAAVQRGGRTATQSGERRGLRPCTACSRRCRSAKLVLRLCFSAGRMARSATGARLRIRLGAVGVTAGALPTPQPPGAEAAHLPPG